MLNSGDFCVHGDKTDNFTPAHVHGVIPYPRERGSTGDAPYIGPRLGDGPIFEVSVLHLDAKVRPGKLPTLAS